MRTTTGALASFSTASALTDQAHASGWESAAAPDFSQRFTGTFDDDHNTIVGRWEISSDGSTWNHDFDLTYTRLR